ncbi:F0F1 ATP synthase subunit B [Blattabacterium cuenoti]|uniref:F0F1 ATP synthase subunit B n=1 Tax=Blattabacterium cuenoti TaxID=1653831 RepID=UPI00163BB0D5|nr:F0F1 ATP synthase subunit B [Blattabacterium cuenoti]
MDLITPSIGLIVWHSIIFLILILFLSKFAWNPIVNFIDEREKETEMYVNKAHNAKKELKDLENKKNEVLKEARLKRDIILKEAIQIQEKIKLKAKEEGIMIKKKMMEETKKNIQIEKEASVHRLKNEVVDISIQIAEKILKKKLDQTNRQDKFIKELVEKLY